MRAAVTLPIVAIGGIDFDNAAEVIAAGADAVAMVSALAASPDAVPAPRGSPSSAWPTAEPFDSISAVP